MKREFSTSSGAGEVMVYGVDHSPWVQAVMICLTSQGYNRGDRGLGCLCDLNLKIAVYQLDSSSLHSSESCLAFI